MFSRENPNGRDEIDMLPDLEIEYSNISVLREEMIKGYFIIYQLVIILSEPAFDNSLNGLFNLLYAF